MSILDKKKNLELYNSDAYFNNTDMWEDGTAAPRAFALQAAIKDANILTEIDSWADIGCGSGGVIRHVSRSHCLKDCSKYIGIDVSSKAIEIAKELYPEASKNNVRFELIDPSSNGSFIEENCTLVSMIHVIEHVPDMLEFINAYTRNARYVYINVPIEHTLNYALRRGTLKKLYEKYGHLHFFDESFFDEFLISNGFEIMSRTYSLDFKGRKKSFTRAMLNALRASLARISNPSLANSLLSGFSYGVLLKKNN